MREVDDSAERAGTNFIFILFIYLSIYSIQSEPAASETFRITDWLKKIQKAAAVARCREAELTRQLFPVKEGSLLQ